jgi:hypothetical protein
MELIARFGQTATLMMTACQAGKQIRTAVPQL